MTSSDSVVPLDDSAAGHLTAAFHGTPAEPVDGQLPYHDLGGPGLERLTFLLLVEDGKVPQYFGKTGDAQYGIDLLVPDGDRVTVYQCKNYALFSRADLKDALKKFRDEWLSRPHLPRPDAFVLCCPLDLRAKADSKEWETMRKVFHEATGVRVEMWHREYFDERLRKAPDLVADLFSERASGDFCHPLSWRWDVFRPLHPEAPPDIFLDGYHRLCRDGHLVIEDEPAESFTETLRRDGTVLVQGAPGTGKTTTVLALAETVGARVFYVNMRRCDVSDDVLVEGLERRLTRPTVFVFDDCQGRLDDLGGLHYRASRLLRGRGWLVLVARTAPTEGRGTRFEASELEEELAANGSIVVFKNDKAFFGQVVGRRRPEFAGLSEERMTRIFEHSARDLALLDAVLASVDGPSDVDDLELERIYERALRHYFRKLPSRADRLFDLCALAQLELAPTSDWLSMDHLRQEAPAAEALVAYAGQPPRGYFVHASAAKLIARALAWAHGWDYADSLIASLLRFLHRPGASDALRIEELSLALRELKKADEALLVALEKKVGVQRSWRLLLASNNIVKLRQVSQSSSWVFGQQLLTTFASAPADQVARWLLRGDILQVCQFLRLSGRRLAATDSGSFVKRLGPTLRQLVEKADWSTRAQASYQLTNAPPSRLKDDMTSLFWDHLQIVDSAIQEPESLHSFLSCVGLLVTASPGLRRKRPALVERHLGPPDAWTRTPGFLRWNRAVLRMASDPDSSVAMAHQLQRIACGPDVATLLPEASTLDVFLYLWNLYALWFQWREDEAEEFRDVLHGEVRNEAVRVLAERGTAHEDDQDLCNWLALAGVLSFTGLADADEMEPPDPSILPDSDVMGRFVDGVGSVAAALAVLGLEACTGRPCDASLRRAVAVKLDDIPNPTTAMRFLRVALGPSGQAR